MVTQYSVLFILTFLSTAVMLGLAIYIFKFRFAKGAIIFSILLFAIGFWTFSIGMGLLAKTESVSYIWSIFRMVGVFVVPVLWLLFSLEFSDLEIWVNKTNILWLSIIPVISLVLMITNQQHHLFLKDILYVQHGSYLIDETWLLGPWFWVHLIYSYSLILFGDFLLLREASRLSAKYRRQTAVLISGTLIPLLINVSFTFHLIPDLKVNYDPFGFVLAGIIYSFGLFQLRLFNLQPFARKQLIESMADLMLVIDLQQRIVDLNPSANRFFDMDMDGILGKTLTDFTGGLSFPMGENSDLEYVPPGKIDCYFDVRISPIIRNDHLLGHLLVMRDISERKIFEKKLAQLAITDSLTGLFNRRHFLSLATFELERARRYNLHFSLCFLDLDGFKKVNDKFNHAVGDELLVQITSLLKNSIRKVDVLARYGGDEFVILMPETSPDDAKNSIERVQSLIASAEFKNVNEAIKITASAGIVHVKDGSRISIENILLKADQLMYQAKDKGKNLISSEII